MNDARMRDQICSACLAKETLGGVLVGRNLWPKYFDRSASADTVVDSLVNHAHAPSTEQFYESVVADLLSYHGIPVVSPQSRYQKCII